LSALAFPDEQGRLLGELARRDIGQHLSSARAP
jgi:hypothetical protein